MISKNRILALALVSVFSTAHASEPGKLSLWINADKGYAGIQKVGDEFTKKSGVPVVVEHPEDAPGKFQQAAAAGKGPDIWCWPHDRAGEWIAAGLIDPVKPSKKFQSEIDPTAWKAFTMGGKIWAYPISIEAIALIYNKDLIAKPPKTMEEIPALDKMLKAKGKSAILWEYQNTYFTWPLLAANGGYPYKQKPDGSYDASDTGVNNAGALKGAELLAKFVKEGIVPEDTSGADTEAGVNSGSVAMMINGPWAWDNLKKSKINFAVAPIPSVAGKSAAPFLGVLGCMINHSSVNKELAVEFLEKNLLTVPGLEAMNAATPLGVPANKAFFNKLKNDPNIQATMESASSGHPMPNNPEMGRFWASMAPALGNLANGRQTPKEALDNAAKRMTAK
jgi:maltose/maltodextrin transport system substrate-binding protein